MFVMLNFLYMTTIILGAGLSTRMGTNKLLLSFQGETVLGATIQTALKVSDKVIVVVGHEREKIEAIAHEKGVETVYNPSYPEGQKTSTLRGITAVEDDDFAILPGDLPLIQEQDLLSIYQTLGKASIARGIYKGIPGHPVAYQKENRDRLLTYPGTMKEYLKEVGFLKVPTSIGTVYDVDTPERYQAVLDSNGNLSVLDTYLD